MVGRQASEGERVFAENLLLRTGGDDTVKITNLFDDVAKTGREDPKRKARDSVPQCSSFRRGSLFSVNRAEIALWRTVQYYRKRKY